MSQNRLNLKRGVILVLVVSTGAILAWTQMMTSTPSANMVSETVSGLSTENPVGDASGDEAAIDDMLAPTSNAPAASTARGTSVSGKTSSSKNPVDTFSRLRALRRCERSFGERCLGLSARKVGDVSETPAGLMNALADQTASELVRLKLVAEEEMARGQTPSFSVTEVAGAYAKHPDDHVREKALGLAELVVFSEPRAALKIASQVLSTTVSGPLTEKALAILQATQMSDPGTVEQTLVSALTRGGWEVRDRVARGLLPFLNSENRDTYARELSRAPARSKQALYLRLNLEEFDRMERL